MGLGIREPRSAKHVQGTSKLFDDQIVPLRGNALRMPPPGNSNLKHGVGRDADILLVPQPSDSPNDPLVAQPSPALAWPGLACATALDTARG